MRFDSVLTDEELVSNLTIAHSPGDKIEDLEFPFCNPEVANIFIINGKGLDCTHRNLTYNDNLLFSSKFQTQPNPNARKQHGNQTTVDLEGMLDDKKTVLN